jgi:phosphonate transport system ATP-binding protein
MLKLVDCAVTYPSGVAALATTSLEFLQGQFTVLVGSSGAGKSTLLRTLNGLVRPSRGDVRVEDYGSIFASARVLRRHRLAAAMIFQQHHLIGRLSVLQNVLLGRLGWHGSFRSLLPLPRCDRLIALQMLDRLGLIERALDRADRLSGGEQQRVGIARAMAQAPRILLCDEPVASLDPATAEMVLADLHRICREDGITAVVSLHQLEFAQQFADRIIGLASGRVVFDGGPRELKRVAVDKIYGASVQPCQPQAAA